MPDCTIRSDREFQGLIPPLTERERGQLEENLLRDGCLDPLLVWREKSILLDGHNRLEICKRHGLRYQTREVSLPDRAAATLWIEEHQLGRRNLTDDQRAALAFRIQQRRSALAKKQRAAKGTPARQARKRDAALSADVSDKVSGPKQDTRAAVAREARVSQRKLRTIAEVAKTLPELVDEIARGKLTVKAALKRARRQAREKARA